MAERSQTAYITGAASGIGRAVAEKLVQKGVRVFLVDRDIEGLRSLVSTLNENGEVAHCAEASVDSWSEQAAAFKAAVSAFKRIDYVFPIAGIGEDRYTPKKGSVPDGEFVEPDLTCVKVDLDGVLYTVSLAVQQFRRQDIDGLGFRGKIGVTASVCSIYCVPTMPLYTAAKHGVAGLVRSYGKYLPEENITMNAVCPSIVVTNIFKDGFYNSLEDKSLICSMEHVLGAFEHMLGDNKDSGELYEVAPGKSFVRREAPAYLDEKSEKVCDVLHERTHILQEP